MSVSAHRQVFYSTLDSAGADALDEGLLRQKEDNNHWDRKHDGRRQQQMSLISVGANKPL